MVIDSEWFLAWRRVQSQVPVPVQVLHLQVQVPVPVHENQYLSTT